jgi:hypothetical protein
MEFSKQDGQSLGPLAGYVQRIAYRMDDARFDHEKPNDPPYCCDQVIADFSLLKLCIVPFVAKEMGWDSAKVDEVEREYLKKLFQIFITDVSIESRNSIRQQRRDDMEKDRINQWHTEWKK